MTVFERFLGDCVLGSHEVRHHRSGGTVWGMGSYTLWRRFVRFLAAMRHSLWTHEVCRHMVYLYNTRCVSSCQRGEEDVPSQHVQAYPPGMTLVPRQCLGTAPAYPLVLSMR